MDLTGGGGLRRIGEAPPKTEITQAPEAGITPEVQAPEPGRAHANWGARGDGRRRARPGPWASRRWTGALASKGKARGPGDLVFTGVTFPDPVSAVPTSAAIGSTSITAANVGPDGVVVAEMGGFTPDRQGFTLITTALGAGPVRVDGQYVVEI